MAKIKLALEDLSVESFHVTASGTERGTVLGHESEGTCNYSNCPRTCTDMTDCWGDCYPASGALGCPGGPTEIHEYTCHLQTCAYYVTCPGYKHDATCDDSCDPYATCAAQCGG